MTGLLPRSILLWLMLLLVGTAHAQSCTTSSGSGDFGSVDSISLYDTAQSTAASAGFACSGSALSLITTNYITVTLSSSANASGTGAQLYNATSGDYVPYSIYVDSSYSTSLAVGDSYRWEITSLLGLLGLFNSSAGTIPLYLLTATGANVAAGTYTDTLTLTWDYQICWVGLVACVVSSSGTSTNTVPVTLEVSDICEVVDAPDVDFGSAALPSGFSTISSQLQVRCTLAAAYAINLSSSDADTWRVMSGTDTSNSGYTLEYQLYQSSGDGWTQDNDLSGTGTGLAAAIAYTAQINPDQDTRPAGSYSDTVTVTVSY